MAPNQNQNTTTKTEVPEKSNGISEMTSLPPGHQHQQHQLDLRQPSSTIYSLTLDEIQNAVCEPGKSFGSMNMDEFLNNIWSTTAGADETQSNNNNNFNTTIRNNMQHNQQQLLQQQQGSLNLPSPLSRKTVDEVWVEINGGGNDDRCMRDDQQQQQQQQMHADNDVVVVADRQPTFGEMTLEDFLIKAGVVREGFSSTTLSTSAVDVLQPVPLQQHYPSVHNGLFNGSGYSSPAGSPTVSTMHDGCGQVEDSSSGGGIKRSADGTVEKVAERRQRRMIKNRESAARSRARKQAYTVELEVELNQLKEENARLREEERKIQETRRQMMRHSMNKQSEENVVKVEQNLRRCTSCSW